MWFKKDRAPKEPRERRASKVPEGLWVKCDNCRQILYNKELARNFKICPKCGFHFRLSAHERLRMLFDDERYTEIDGHLRSADPLKFRDSKKYRDRLRDAEENVGTSDAIVIGSGTLEQIPVLIGAMEFFFMAGSMGSVVGEKVTRAAERAIAERRPLILVSCSGGARMQEGILSLMQMGKISAALATARRAPHPLPLGDDRSHDRRRDRLLRDAGRPERRRAQRADRLRRAARDRADDPPDAPRRIPALRVPARARNARLHRGPLRDEGHARAVPAPALDPARGRRKAAGGNRSLSARERRLPPPASGLPHLHRLESLGQRGVRLGLAAIDAVCERLGRPERRVPSVLVAGTNGKGSTAATLASIVDLRRAPRPGSTPRPT